MELLQPQPADEAQQDQAAAIETKPTTNSNEIEPQPPTANGNTKKKSSACTIL